MGTLGCFYFFPQSVYFLACRLPLRTDWCEGCTFRDLHKHQRTKESSSTNHLNPRNSDHYSQKSQISEIRNPIIQCLLSCLGCTLSLDNVPNQLAVLGHFRAMLEMCVSAEVLSGEFKAPSHFSEIGTNSATVMEQLAHHPLSESLGFLVWKLIKLIWNHCK